MKIQPNTMAVIDFRCWITDKRALFPMDVTVNVDSQKELDAQIKESKEEYEKDYMKVDFVKVTLI